MNVNIAIDKTYKGWIIWRVANAINKYLPYTKFNAPTNNNTDIIFFPSYGTFNKNLCKDYSAKSIVYLSHLPEKQINWRTRFLNAIKIADLSVFMSSQYEKISRDIMQWETERPVVPIGIDINKLPPKLRLGIFGKFYPDEKRKGENLIKKLKEESNIELVITQGKLTLEQVWELYYKVDYILITSTVEANPMSLLEGLSAGRNIIAPSGVGRVDEFANLTPNIITYKKGDFTSLKLIIDNILKQKQEAHNLVKDQTWFNMAMKFDTIFKEVYNSGTSKYI